MRSPGAAKIGQWVVCRYEGAERRAQITAVFDTKTVGVNIYLGNSGVIECGRPSVLYAATDAERSVDDRWWHRGPKEVIQELRGALSSDELWIIERVWTEFKRTGEWPTAKATEVACHKEGVEYQPRLPFLRPLSGHRAPIVLTLAGLRFVPDATKEVGWVVSVIRALADAYVTDPDRPGILATDLQSLSGLSSDVIGWVAGFLVNNEPQVDRNEHRTFFPLGPSLLAAADATSLDEIICEQSKRESAVGHVPAVRLGGDGGGGSPDAGDSVSVADRRFALLAIEEARKSIHEQDGRQHPFVGAVVVRDGEVVGKAHRGELGKGEHGEFTLLEKKLPDEVLVGATVYVTLEPCTTRNHPKVCCAARLLERKVTRVVIGMVDPDDRISGKGIMMLRQGRVEVQFFPGDLADQVEELNRRWMRSVAGVRVPSRSDDDG